MALTRPRYSQIYDTDYKQSVTVATTGDLGNVYASSLTNTIDGVTLAYLDRILVKDQTDAKQNGIYEVLVVGTGANGVWRRSLDTNTDDKVTSGLRTIVSAGSVNIGKEFRLITADPIVVGTTGLSFADIAANPIGGNTQIQFNDAGVMGASPAFTFNKSGNIFTVANLTITSNTSANIVSFTASGTQSNIGFVINPKNYGYVSITGNTGLVIPTGTTAQQAPAVTGAVRFNTTTSQFEGYGGTNWSSLGGVRSVDGLTFITAELTSGSSDDTLRFYASNNTNAVEVARLNTANLLVNISTPSTSTTTGAFNVLGGAGIGGNVNAGSLTTPGARHTFAGNVFVTGINGGGSIFSVTDQSASTNATKTIVATNGDQSIWLTANLGPGNWNGTVQARDVGLIFQSSAQNFANLTIAGWSNSAGGTGLRFITAINQINTPGQFLISNTTAATSTTTGALVVAGGAGIDGNLYVGGTQQATSTSSGALVVSGGASVGKDLWIGGNLYVANVNSVTYGLLQINDPLVYLTSNVTFPYNYTIGFYGQYTGGPSNVYAHTGFVRSPDDNRWHLLSNIGEPSGGNLNIFDTNGIYDPLVTGTHTTVGNIIAIGNIIASGNITTNISTPSTSNVTGAVTVSGGIGVGGNLYVGRRVGFVYGNAVSAVYQVYNQTTGSLDTVFG